MRGPLEVSTRAVAARDAAASSTRAVKPACEGRAPIVPAATTIARPAASAIPSQSGERLMPIRN